MYFHLSPPPPPPLPQLKPWCYLADHLEYIVFVYQNPMVASCTSNKMCWVLEQAHNNVISNNKQQQELWAQNVSTRLIQGWLFSFQLSGLHVIYKRRSYLRGLTPAQVCRASMISRLGCLRDLCSYHPEPWSRRLMVLTSYQLLPFMILQIWSTPIILNFHTRRLIFSLI